MIKKSLSLLGLLALAACATPTDGATDDAASNPLDDPRVGKKVDRICFTSGISGFREWEGGDGLILRRGTRQQFLVTFFKSCAPLDDAQRIGLNDGFSGGCLNRGDSVFVSSDLFPGGNSSPFDSQRCPVQAIYEWNDKADVEDAAADAMGAGDQ